MMDSSLGPEAGAGMLVRRPVDMGGVDAPKLAEKIVKNVSAAFTVLSTHSLCSIVLLRANPTHPPFHPLLSYPSTFTYRLLSHIRSYSTTSTHSKVVRQR